MDNLDQIQESNFETNDPPVQVLVLPSDNVRFNTTYFLRSVYLLFGVLFPLGCFIALARGFSPLYTMVDESIVSNQFNIIVTAAFFPLALYSMICMTLALFKPLKTKKKFFIRLGVYSGIIISLHYAVMFILSFAGNTKVTKHFPFVLPEFLCYIIPTIILIPLFLGLIWKYLWRTSSRKKLEMILGTIFFTLPILFAVYILISLASAPVLLIIIFEGIVLFYITLLGPLPIWTGFVYFRMSQNFSRQKINNHQV